MRFAKSSATTFLSAWLVAAASAQVVQEAFLPANVPVQSDILGYDVGIDGPVIVGGAPFGTLQGRVQTGRTFVFELVDGLWQQTRILRPSVRQANAWFGIDVTVHGTTIVSSALGENSRSGAAYVYEKSGGVWTQSHRLTPANHRTIDLFGGGLSLSDDVLVIGSVGHATPSGSETGSSFIFRRDGADWIETAMLYPAQGTPFGNFGIDSALQGNTAVIAALTDDNRGVNEAGAAHVFELLGGGAWSETAKLLASDPTERAHLGAAVAINRAADKIVAGADRAQVDGVQVGAAYIFELTDGTWQQTVKLTAPDAQLNDAFGQSVAIVGNTIMVGAFLEDDNGAGAGAAYVFRHNGKEWVFDTKIVAHVRGNLTYGWSLGMSGDRAVVAAPFYQVNRGGLYIYTGLSDCDQPCDTNCDGLIDSFDIEPFLGLLFGGDEPCNTCSGDANGDGVVDAFDIEAFLLCLFP